MAVMPATSRQLRRQPAARAARATALLWLALMALALRALVPAGYMPDVGALHDGRLEVTFCSAAGAPPALALQLAVHGQLVQPAQAQGGGRVGARAEGQARVQPHHGPRQVEGGVDGTVGPDGEVVGEMARPESGDLVAARAPRPGGPQAPRVQ